VDGHEHLAQRLELREGGGAAVDPCAAAALRVEHPSQQHLVAVAGQRVLGEPRPRRRAIGDVEAGSELGALGTGAQLADLEPVAEQESDRIQQDRLAGPRFAGEDGEPLAQRDVERLHHHEVADRKRAKHQCLGFLPSSSGVALQCSFSRSVAK
jgi:hypothetical protein